MSYPTLPPITLVLWFPTFLLSLVILASNSIYSVYWLVEEEYYNYSDFSIAYFTIQSLLHIKLIGIYYAFFWDLISEQQQLADFYYAGVHPTLADTLVWCNHTVTYPGIAAHLKSLSDGADKLSILDPKFIHLCPGSQHFHLVMGIYGRILGWSALVIWLNSFFTWNLKLSWWFPLSLVVSLLSITTSFSPINCWLIEQGYYLYSSDDFSTAFYTTWSLFRIRLDVIFHIFFPDLIINKPEDFYIRIHPTRPEALIWGKYEVTYPGIADLLSILSGGAGNLHILDPTFIYLCPGYQYFNLVAGILLTTLVCSALIIWLHEFWLKRKLKNTI